MGPLGFLALSSTTDRTLMTKLIAFAVSTTMLVAVTCTLQAQSSLPKAPSDSAPKTTDQVFKNIQVLKGIPVDPSKFSLLMANIMDLPDVISAILSSDAWPSIPTVPPNALACFFLGVIGLPQTPLGSASRFVRERDFSAVRFRDCRRTFLTFKPPSLLVSQIAPTAADFAGRPRLLLPGGTCFVASARTGYATRLIQAIDGERTFTFPDLRSCRLLQGPGRQAGVLARTILCNRIPPLTICEL